MFHLDKQIYILEQWTLFTGSEVGIYERKQESHQEKKKKRKQALDQESKIQEKNDNWSNKLKEGNGKRKLELNI